MSVQNNVKVTAVAGTKPAFCRKLLIATFSGWVLLAISSASLSLASFNVFAGASDSGGGSDSGGSDSGGSDASDSGDSGSDDSGSDDGSGSDNNRKPSKKKYDRRDNPSYSLENSDSGGSSNEPPRRRASPTDEQRKAFIRNNLEAILEELVRQGGETIDALAELYDLNSQDVVDRLLPDIELLTKAESEQAVIIIHGWLLRD